MLLCDAERTEAEVVVFSCDRLTADVVAELRRSVVETGSPVVLIIDDVTGDELLAAVQCGVVAVLPHVAVTVERLTDSVLTAAKGDGAMHPDVVGELLGYIQSLQREVLTPNGLNAVSVTPGEIAALRMVAESLDTKEIADEPGCSQRTVKNVVHGARRRLKLRNRSYSVAYAVCAGSI
jgi:DNA-binding NarL/FixJ family response regulator